jgi:hypothetical protein
VWVFQAKKADGDNAVRLIGQPAGGEEITAGYFWNIIFRCWTNPGVWSL